MPNALCQPGPGLPGKNIKLSQQSRGQTLPAPSTNRTKTSPLGISINTNLQDNSQPPPRQIYPPLHNGSSNSLAEASAKQRKTPPRPLNLKRKISPGDGEIPIVLSIESPQKDIRSSPGRHLSPPYSKTPFIVITPTEDTFGQSSSLPLPSHINKLRMASSVYSPHVNGSQYARRFKTGRSRSSSAATVFEDDAEDLTPLSANPTRLRRSSARSLDSVLPTPLREVGWWNLITSPLPRRTPTGSSKSSSKLSSSLKEEGTPLIDNAEPLGVQTERGNFDHLNGSAHLHDIPIDASLDIYTIPTSGEAARYYDQSINFSTPVLGGRFLESPEPSDFSGTPKSDLLLDFDGDVGQPKHVDSLSRRVPSPQHPIQTPPKSAIAAVGYSFGSNTPPQKSESEASIRRSPPEVVSPYSPLPIVAIASIQHMHKVGSAEPNNKIRISPTNDDSQSEARPLVRSLGNESSSNSITSPRKAGKPNGPATKPPQPVSSNMPKAIQDPNQSQSRWSAISLSPEAPKHAIHLASPFETPEVPNSVPPPMEKPRPVHHLPQAMSKKLESEKKHRKCTLTKGRIITVAICTFFGLVVLLAIILCSTLIARPLSSVPVEAQWLNLTGYPPLPTGVSTIAGPRLITSQPGCVSQSNMWSCLLPSDQQQTSPNDGPMPNFRLSILYNNGTIANTTAIQSNSTRRNVPHLPAMRIIPRSGLEARSATQKVNLSSSPSPPSTNEQIFLGNVTDNNAFPYNGEATPFYITLLPNTVPTLGKRQLSNTTATANSTENIPAPDINSNGTASPAQLYPFPSAQPLMLFNRGMSSEHYGFYTYFSRSIFLSLSNSSLISNVTDLQNVTGASPTSSSNAVCTWSQTRFLIQIWTQSHATLISGNGTGYALNSSITSAPSAYDYIAPGSFPWPVTVTIDRHGGDAEEKGVYCYSLDSNGKVISTESTAVLEDRGFDGTTVNPAAALTKANGAGAIWGVDGGNGGCKCQYANWQAA